MNIECCLIWVVFMCWILSLICGIYFKKEINYCLFLMDDFLGVYKFGWEFFYCYLIDGFEELWFVIFSIKEC